MTPLRYLKDKIVPLIILVIVILYISAMLYVLSVDVAGIAFICAVIIAAFISMGVYDYLLRRRFYIELQQALEQLDKTYLLSEILTRPGFIEGEKTYDALVWANKDMNDTIAQHRMSSEEYREYIETWIHEIKTPIAAGHLIIENSRDRERGLDVETGHDIEDTRDGESSHGIEGSRDGKDDCSRVTDALAGELDRIEAFVEQALYYSRSSTVEKDYAIRAVDLGEIVRGSLRKQARILIERKITPRLENLNYEVFTDAKWLDFIVGQVVANAAKYRRPDEEDAYLVFSCQEVGTGLDSAQVVLSITDDGIGMPESDVSRVFEKGFTGENGRMFARSTGIGLYLCRKLCDKMGLAIALTSTQGQGTTISITFPLNTMYFAAR